jgi:hypothetical protein
MTYYEVDYVHHMILAEAADAANRELLLATQDDRNWSDHFDTTDIFRADPVASDLGGLCLSIDPLHTMGRPQEILVELHKIGERAIFKSLLDHKDQFVGLILGHARIGRNYFDRWPDNNGQLRLF